MARIEFELDDKGDFVGDVPTELKGIFDRIENAARTTGMGMGIEQAAKDAKKQIEANVKAEVARLNALAPIERERYAQIDETNKTLKQQIFDVSREHDRTIKAQEENHARELLARSEALKQRDSRIQALTRSQVRAEAKAAGARDKSIDELEVILASSIGFSDDMEAFVKNPDGTQKLLHGKPQPLGAFVKEYLDSHPHHRKPPASGGGGARGGATLHGQHQPTSVDSARSRIEGGDRGLQAINELFQAARNKAAS